MTNPNEAAPDMLLASAAGDVRIGPIICIPEVLRELGVSPRRACAQAGVKLQLFNDPENRVSFQAISRLLSVCEDMTSCDHFGLLVGQRFSLRGLDTIGDLMRNSATVGEALRALLLHLHLHDRGAAPVLLKPEPARVLLGYSIYRLGIPSAKPIYDVVIAVAYKILRELCGPSWKPVRVQFAHARPQDLEPYRRLFGTRIHFDAEVSGVVFDASWLEHSIAGADLALRDRLREAIRNAEAGVAMTFAEEVRAVLHQMVLSGTALAEDVANLFGIHERTLRKRLGADGTSLKDLVAQTRFELARQLLQDTQLSVAEIAAALRYSDPNVFSRAFRGWADVSPRQWRARIAGHLKQKAPRIGGALSQGRV
jgi:AraC-like DNA-binding protein